MGSILKLMEDKRTMDEVFAEFEEFAVGEVNETYEGYLFNEQCQHQGKSFEIFLTIIRSLIKYVIIATHESTLSCATVSY